MDRLGVCRVALDGRRPCLPAGCRAEGGGIRAANGGDDRARCAGTPVTGVRGVADIDVMKGLDVERWLCGLPKRRGLTAAVTAASDTTAPGTVCILAGLGRAAKLSVTSWRGGRITVADSNQMQRQRGHRCSGCPGCSTRRTGQCSLPRELMPSFHFGTPAKSLHILGDLSPHTSRLKTGSVT